MNRMKRRISQSMTEAAIIFAAVVIGMIAMRVYIKRGFSGYYKRNSEMLGADVFSPRKSHYNKITYSPDFNISTATLPHNIRIDGENRTVYTQTTFNDAVISSVYDGQVQRTGTLHGQDIVAELSSVSSGAGITELAEQMNEVLDGGVAENFDSTAEGSVMDDFSGDTLNSDTAEYYRYYFDEHPGGGRTDTGG